MQILYVGSFLKDNPLSMKSLAYATHYWSNKKEAALFCQHEGYGGCMGSFVSHMR